MVANQVDSVHDIDPAYGSKLAAYLAAFKPDEEEHRQMMLYAAKLARWNAVRLGLVDQLQKLPSRDTQLQELLSSAIGEPVDLGSEAGRGQAQRRLLSAVLADLADVPETDNDQWKVFDQGSAALTEFYSAQARLLGVPPEAYSPTPQPSTVLRALVEHVAGKLDTAKLSPEEGQFIAELAYRLNALDFVSTNDIQRTALLEITWMRILALQIIQLRPDKAVPAREITADVPSAANTHANVFEQLRDQQSRLLRLWLLHQPADMEPAATDI
jgi:hypothetical protein